MRPDMAKVIVERPRHGWRLKYPRQTWRRIYESMDDLPTREPHRARHQRTTKGFNEHLGPLRKFLRASLGRPWDEVRAEIAAVVPDDTTINHHVWQHIRMDVAETVIEIDGVLYDTTWYRLAPVEGFFVHPGTGLLCEMPRETGRERVLRRRLKEEDPDRLRIDHGTEYRRVGGVWYHVVYATLGPRDLRGWDVVEHKEVTRHWSEYAMAKRQLDKREIRREVLPRLAAAARRRAAMVAELVRARRRRATPVCPVRLL